MVQPNTSGAPCPARQVEDNIARYIAWYENANKRERRNLHFYLFFSRAFYFIAMIFGISVAARIDRVWLGENAGAQYDAVLPFLVAVCAAVGYFISRFVETRAFLRAWLRYSVALVALTNLRDVFKIERLGFQEPLTNENFELCLKRQQEACAILSKETAQFALDAHVDYTNLIETFNKFDPSQANKPHAPSA
jgi:hypothetical protein